MHTASTSDFNAAIRELFPGCGFPPIERSAGVMVPSRAWFESNWNQQWWDYCAAREFRYLPGSGMCEQFSRAALTELNFNCIETVRQAEPDRRDVHVAAREVFVMIAPGAELNGVRDGMHSTILVWLHEADGTRQLWFWEPQNRRLTLASRAAAQSILCFFAQ